jgi:hypothetical protein
MCVGALGADMVTPIKVKDLATGYTDDPWFKEDLNTKLLLKHKGLWWKDDKLIVSNIESIKEKILHLCHSSPYAGHVGRNKTYDLVARSYWWPGVRKYVESYCKTCDSC